MAACLAVENQSSAPAVKENVSWRCPEDSQICSEVIRTDGFYPQDQLVLGIAASKREAYTLAGRMLLDAMHEDGSIHIDELY